MYTNCIESCQRSTHRRKHFFSSFLFSFRRCISCFRHTYYPSAKLHSILIKTELFELVFENWIESWKTFLNRKVDVYTFVSLDFFRSNRFFLFFFAVRKQLCHCVHRIIYLVIKFKNLRANSQMFRLVHFLFSDCL